MSKSFFTKSRSIVTLAAFWKLNKHSDHSSLERMSTFFVPRANHFFKFSCIMIKTLDNWKSIPTIHPVKGRRQFFCKEYYHCLLTTLDNKRAFLCATHMTWSVQSMPKKVQQRRFLANWAPRRFGAKLDPAKGLVPFRCTVKLREGIQKKSIFFRK